MQLQIKTATGSYPIYVERGGLARAREYFNLARRVLVITDTGVPPAYAAAIAGQCRAATVYTFEQGENSKNTDTYIALLAALVENGFTRTDCVVAVGGGVVGDMAGFAAATYMRGIDFYNIPTTLLAQVDSSIGGKTAIDFMGYKKLVGSFYPPKGVLIDPAVLATLPARQISNGLAESLKMASTHDETLFSLLADGAQDDGWLEQVILRSLTIKKQVVEADERESGQRKVLNFGHTLGHAIESVCGLDTYYHGECVALGMLPMCAPAVRAALRPVLQRLGLPTAFHGRADAVIEACRHDKKAAGDTLTVVFVPVIGQYEIQTVPFSEYEQMIREVLER